MFPLKCSGDRHGLLPPVNAARRWQHDGNTAQKERWAVIVLVLCLDYGVAAVLHLRLILAFVFRSSATNWLILPSSSSHSHYSYLILISNTFIIFFSYPDYNYLYYQYHTIIIFIPILIQFVTLASHLTDIIANAPIRIHSKPLKVIKKLHPMEEKE